MRAFALIFAMFLATVFYYVIYAPQEADSVTHHIATVTHVDNDRVTIIGTGRLGEQKLSLDLDGRQVQVRNLLTGAMEYDEFYQVGNYIVVAEQDGRYHAVALFRLPVLTGLMLLFALGLLAYARKVGFYSLLSFVGSVAVMFTVLIPGLLAGISPLLITTITLLFLSAMIIYSVAGWSIKALAAMLGTTAGLFVTTLLCLLVGHLLHLDGMSQPLAQSLLFEHGMRLDMLAILNAAILVGASGAAMDVAMEMSATMEELKLNSPDMTRQQLLRSGLRVGNAVIGTMTTTLLLAYAGGFLTLLMLFASRGNSLMQILNMKLVASEVCRTLIGSIALIIVAPVTAWIASYMLEKYYVTRSVLSTESV